MGELDQSVVARVFHEAVRRPASKRAAFLDRACAQDPALRDKVEELLAALEIPGDFLAPIPGILADLPAGPAVDDPPHSSREGPGSRIGRYKLLKPIGEGGMGIVFMAEQEQPVKRRVALKIIKPGMDTRQVIARFEAERQALAMMDHPGIARVFDAGETDSGRPYFVMELVKGKPITEYCDENRVDIKSRLQLFAQVCRAIQHAHQKGIIHRDIKPPNVLVSLQEDDKPVPKVIDFGIAKATQAKLTDKTLFTGWRQLMGTPQYMSPEQSDAGATDVDARSDIYSLGVLLYELLTGTTPIDPKEIRSKGFGEVQRMVRDSDPPKPSTRIRTLEGNTPSSIAARRQTDLRKLCGLVRGDLDWVVMRCLEKDRTRRYETAGALATDVERYLRGETVSAGRPSIPYRVRKFVRRHRFGVVAFVAVAVICAVGTLILMSRRPSWTDFASKQLTSAPARVPATAPAHVAATTPAPGTATALATAPAMVSSTAPVMVTATAPAPREVDLIPLIDPAKDAVSGVWTVADKKLISDETQFARLRIPYQPPDEYDFHIEFERLTGDNDITQILPVGRQVVAWQMAGDHGNIWGFDQVHGHIRVAKPAPPLRYGRRHTSVVKVRKDWVSAFFDGVPAHKVPADTWFASPHRWSLGAADLGLGTSKASTSFHVVKLMEVTGRGRFRPNRPAEPPAGAKVVSLLNQINISRDRTQGRWKWSNGVLSSNFGGPPMAISIPYSPPDEYDFRVTFSRLNSTEAIDAIQLYVLHPRGSVLYELGANKNTIHGFDKVGGKEQNENPTTLWRVGILENGRQYTCLVQVRKDCIAVYLDGALLARYEGDYSDLEPANDSSFKRDRLGIGSHWTEINFHSVEVVEISGSGKLLTSDAKRTTADGSSGAPSSTQSSVAVGESAPPVVKRGIRSVAFVGDATASMMNRLDRLKAEVRNAVRLLDSNQSFSVVFFSGEGMLTFSQGSSVKATAESKAEFEKWIKTIKVSGGGTDAIGALAAALAHRPDVIYLLTDGDFPNRAEFANACRRLNRDGHTRLNTVALIDPTQATSGQFLGELAKASGGVFKRIDVAPER